MERLRRAWRKVVWGEELVARLGSIREGVRPQEEPEFDPLRSKMVFELVRVRGQLYVRFDLGPSHDGGFGYISVRAVPALQSILNRALDKAAEASPDPDRRPAKPAGTPVSLASNSGLSSDRNSGSGSLEVT